MLARPSGTRCQMNLEIRTALIVLNSSCKQFCSVAISVTSALEVFQSDALCFTYFHTYLPGGDSALIGDLAYIGVPASIRSFTV